MDNQIVKIAYLDFSPVFAGAARVLFNAISVIDHCKALVDVYNQVIS